MTKFKIILDFSESLFNLISHKSNNIEHISVFYLHCKDARETMFLYIFYKTTIFLVQ